MDGPPGRDDDGETVFCTACGERICRRVNFCRHCGEPNRAQSTDRSTRVEAESDRMGTEDTAITGERSGERAGRPAADPEVSPADVSPDETRENTPQWRSYLPTEQRHERESPTRVIGAATAIGIAGILGLLVVTLLTAGVGTVVGLSQTESLILGTIVGQYLGFIGLGLWYLRWRGFDWDSIWGYLGVRRPTLTEVGIAVGSWFIILGLLIGVSIVLEVLLDLLGAGEPDQAEQGLDDIIGDDPLIVVGAILMMFLVVGPCEELLFRGVVQGRLRERLSAAPAIAIASGLFAVVHVIGLAGSLQAVALGISVLFLTSLVLGGVYEYTGSLVAVSILHGLHNSIVVLILWADAVYDLEELVLWPAQVVLQAPV